MSGNVLVADRLTRGPNRYYLGHATARECLLINEIAALDTESAAERDHAFEAGRLFGMAEEAPVSVARERGRILDLLAHHAAHEYHGGWIRRLIEAIEAGETPAQKETR